MEELPEKSEKWKTDLLDRMKVKLNHVLEEVLDTVDEGNCNSARSTNSDTGFASPSYLLTDKRKSSIVGKLPEKVFQCRESLLTELFKISHFKTIHHIFIATLSLFMIHAVVIDLLQTGTLDLGMDMLLWAFGSWSTLFSYLISMNAVAIFGLYPVFHYWVNYRQEINTHLRSKVDTAASLAFGIFMCSFILIPAILIWKNPLPPAAGIAVTMEQCRLLMKMYAFTRTSSSRITGLSVVNANEKTETKFLASTPENSIPDSVDTLRRRGTTNGIHLNVVNEYRHHARKRQSWITWNDEKESGCPGFSKYIYFMFVPTLIYKDNYPMKKIIRWDVVGWNFAQCLGCIIYANFILTRFGSAYFSNFGKPDHQMNLTQLIDALFCMMLPGIVILVLSFFLLLHAWQNAFAEMLCFGDRLFYKDWWNCSSFAVYYKTWNLIVHDWLYNYIYKDAVENGLGQKWKPLPTTLVFLISSLFHEYILSTGFNFFFPVLLTLFGGFGFVLVFIRPGKSAIGNIIMWICLVLGTGFIVTFYMMEYYARLNCPPAETMDYIKPRTFTCGAISFSL